MNLEYAQKIDVAILQKLQHEAAYINQTITEKQKTKSGGKPKKLPSEKVSMPKKLKLK